MGWGHQAPRACPQPHHRIHLFGGVQIVRLECNPRVCPKLTLEP